MKVVLLTSKAADEFQISVLDKLINSRHKILGWVVDTRETKSLYEKLKHNIKKGRGGYVLIMAFSNLFMKKETMFDLSPIMRKSNKEIYYTDQLNSSDCINKIMNLNPDVLILLGGFGIIKGDLINLCKYGVISYHHGDMEKYRGQPVGFWELYNNESTAGVMVQKLSEGLDCGEPIKKITIPIKKTDSLRSLRKRMYSDSVDMLVDSLDFLELSSTVLTKYKMYGKIYTLPNLRQWLYFNLKMLFRSMNF